MRAHLVRSYEKILRVWTVALWGREADVRQEFITPEEFELELVELGLSGKRFGPEEYAEALGRHLGIRVRLQYLKDAYHPGLSKELAFSGRLAETLCFAELREALVLIPGGLPSPAKEMTAFHELAHLAAGDHLESSGGRALASRKPSDSEEAREREADLRAAYALSAGSLGRENPYARKILEAL